MAFYKMQIEACNTTSHHILKCEVDLILPKFYMEQRNERVIFGTIISGFIGLAFEGIFSFLHHKRHKALHKAVKVMSISIDAQRNKLMHLENTLVMYGIYNAETYEKLVKMVQVIHIRQTLIEDLFSSQSVAAYGVYLQMHGSCGMHHYVINSMLYLHTIKNKYIKIITNLSHNYEYMLRQLEYWLKVICPFCL